MNGKAQNLNWPLKTEASQNEFAFLPKLISTARRDQGASLPTVGSAGLREIARVLNVQSSQLALLGQQARNRGDVASAKTLRNAALKNNPLADALLNDALQDDDPFADDPFESGDSADDAATQDDPFNEDAAPQDDPFNNDSAPEDDPFNQAAPADDPAADDPETLEPMEDLGPVESGSEDLPQPAQDPDRPVLPNQIQPGSDQAADMVDDGAIRLVNPNVVPSGTNDEVEDLLRSAAPQSENILDTQDELNRVLTQRLRARFRVEMQRANQEIRSGAPGDAVERLKTLLEVMDQVSGVDNSVKVDLRARLMSALQSATREKLEYDQADCDRSGKCCDSPTNWKMLKLTICVEKSTLRH